MRVAWMLLLLVAAAPASSPAWAEWVKVGRTDAAVHYVDPATISRDGSLRTVWALQDLLDPGEDGVMSIRALQEYDCADGTSRFLALTAHARPMGRGEVLVEHALRDRWTARPRGATASVIGNIVCGN